MTRRCEALKRGGERCKSAAMATGPWCFNHSPEKADQRRQNASRGGRTGGRGRGGGRGGGELRAVKDRLLELADDVLGGEVTRSDAAVTAQVLNVFLRALEVERRTADMGELLERLDLLEQRADKLRGA